MARIIQHKKISIENLWLGYEQGVPLLESASAEVNEGEMIALVGRNGTGKSTLLRTLARLQAPMQGRVMLNGTPVEALSNRELARLLSFAGPGTGTMEDLTVFELVSLGRHPYTNWWGALRDADREKINESLSFTGMLDFRDARVNRLSDGERQRVLIAMALAQDTDLLILDEPTAFLDIPNRIDVVEVLHRLRSQNRTVIFSTHDFDNVFSYADQVWIIDERRLITGSPEELGLEGAFDALFSDAGVRFDRHGLRFVRETDHREQIGLAGEDRDGRFWTARALERTGYRVEDAEEGGKPVVEVRKVKGVYRWILTLGSTTKEFTTLYELISHLTRS